MSQPPYPGMPKAPPSDRADGWLAELHRVGAIRDYVRRVCDLFLAGAFTLVLGIAMLAAFDAAHAVLFGMPVAIWLAQGWMVYGESRAFLRELDDKQ